MGEANGRFKGFQSQIQPNCSSILKLSRFTENSCGRCSEVGNTEILIYALLLGFWSVCEIQVLARQIQSISFSNYLREANFLADSLASLYWRSPFLICWSSSSWSVGVEVFVGILICKCCPLYEEENITLDSSHFSERIVIVIDNIIHSKFAEPTSQHIYKSNTQRDIIRTLNFV